MPHSKALAITACHGRRKRSSRLRTPAMISVSTTGLNSAIRNSLVAPETSPKSGPLLSGAIRATIQPINVLPAIVSSQPTRIASHGRSSRKRTRGRIASGPAPPRQPGLWAGAVSIRVPTTHCSCVVGAGYGRRGVNDACGRRVLGGHSLLRHPGLGPGSTEPQGGDRASGLPLATGWTPDQVRGDGVGRQPSPDTRNCSQSLTKKGAAPATPLSLRS